MDLGEIIFRGLICEFVYFAVTRLMRGGGGRCCPGRGELSAQFLVLRSDISKHWPHFILSHFISSTDVCLLVSDVTFLQVTDGTDCFWCDGTKHRWNL